MEGDLKVCLPICSSGAVSAHSSYNGGPLTQLGCDSYNDYFSQFNSSIGVISVDRCNNEDILYADNGSKICSTGMSCDITGQTLQLDQSTMMLTCVTCTGKVLNQFCVMSCSAYASQQTGCANQGLF